MKRCLISNVDRDARLAKAIEEFANYKERREAWLSLPMEDRKMIIWYAVTQGHGGLYEKFKSEGMRQSLREIGDVVQLVMDQNWYPDQRDLAKYIHGLLHNFIKGPSLSYGKTDSILVDKIVELVYLKALEYAETGDNQAQVQEFWNYLELPTRSLIGAMDEKRMKDYLQHVVHENFTSIESEKDLADRIEDWQDMYRRRCLNFVDPTHTKWQEFGLTEEGERNEFDERMEQVMLQDLLRPPSLSLPDRAPQFISNLHQFYKNRFPEGKIASPK